MTDGFDTVNVGFSNRDGKLIPNLELYKDYVLTVDNVYVNGNKEVIYGGEILPV